VQLIEQRLELGVGDFVTARRAALQLPAGLRLDRIERVEQLFELAVGDVLLLGGAGHRRGTGRCRASARTRLGQTRQRGQQFGVAGVIGARAPGRTCC
jgi:hypothetical protein